MRGRQLGARLFVGQSSANVARGSFACAHRARVLTRMCDGRGDFDFR
jgi:hypothetical protein